MGFSSCLLGLDEALLNTNGHRHRQRPEFITGSLGAKPGGVKGFGMPPSSSSRLLYGLYVRKASFVRNSGGGQIVLYVLYRLALIS